MKQVLQRRDWARVDAGLPVRVTLVEADGHRLARTTTLNVSAGGLLIHDPLGLPLGADVDVRLHLDDLAEPLGAHAHVVREEPCGAKGLQLDHMAEADRERIVRYVFARHRIELQLARSRA